MNRRSIAWVLACVTIAACGAHGDKDDHDPTPAPVSATDAGAPKPARILHFKSTADWGAMTVAADTSGAAANVYTVTFELADGAPIRIQVPKDTEARVDDVPAPNAAKPLDASAYTFSLDGKKATGFRFMTHAGEGDPVTISVTRKKPGVYDVELAVGSIVNGKQTLQGLERCPAQGPGGGLAARLAGSPTALAAFAALSGELEKHLAEFDQPEEMMRAITLMFGRLMSPAKLAQAVKSGACGAASLEFVCEAPSCATKMGETSRELKQHDSMTLGVGTSVELLGFGE